MDREIVDRELTFTFTPALVRAAALRFWASYFGWAAGISVLAVAAVGFYFLSVDASVGRWFLAVAAFGVLMFVVGGFTTVRRGMGQLRRMAKPVMTIRFTDDQIEPKSDLGSAQIPWSAVYGLRKYSNLWLVMLTKANYMTLPIDNLDQDLRDFISSKIEKTT